MQDRYFGDIGDFAKYGLLRDLFGGTSELRLGMVWYRVPDESHNADGRHVSYLEKCQKNDSEYRACDPSLYEQLREIVATKPRAIARALEQGILPPGTPSHDQYLTFAGIARTGRGPRRDAWMQAALHAMRDVHVVFADPDNGIETKIARTAKRGRKYVYYDELKAFFRQGKSLIVYQHVSRAGAAEDQLMARFREISQRLETREMWALWFRRVSARFFFVIPQREHLDALARHSQSFLDGRWGRHFQKRAWPPTDLTRAPDLVRHRSTDTARLSFESD